MSPIALNHVFRQIPTTLELNGPILSFDASEDYGVLGALQPTAQAVCNNGVATFTGVATAVWPSQSPPNYPLNTGTISYRWHQVGVGALSDSANVTGTATTVLTITDATNPSYNARNYFLRADYTPSAYGVGKSTPNAINDPLDSNTVGLTVYPTITITTQPTGIVTAAETVTAEFDVVATTSDSSGLDYRWLLNGSDLSDSGTVSGSGTPSLDISLPSVGVNTIQARVTHPTSCDSPVYSTVSTFDVVSSRQMLKFEAVQYDGSAAFDEVNLFDGDYELTNNSSAPLLSFYASEQDIDIEMEIWAAKGSDNGSFTGGPGGYSKVRFTMVHNIEHVIAGYFNNSQSTPFVYRQAGILMVVGSGGHAGPSGNGGAGGGVNIAGASGSGSSGGLGGSLISAGNLTNSGTRFGSNWPGNASAVAPYGVGKAPFPEGGQVAGCSIGGYWRNQGYSPCQLLGNVKFYTAGGTQVTNSASIARGFKAGFGVRNVNGAGDNSAVGGAGCTGGSGGQGGSGGGGGSGYHDGSVTVIDTQQGGSTLTGSKVIFRAV